jgi:hypothetical protein
MPPFWAILEHSRSARKKRVEASTAASTRISLSAHGKRTVQQLLAQAKFSNYFLIPWGVFLAQIGEMTPALADELEQAVARAVVVLVSLQMLDQLVDPGSEDGYLDFRRPSILFVHMVLLYNIFFRCTF